MSLDQRYSKVLDSCLDSLKIWKTFISENLEGSEKDVELEKLKQTTKDYMKIHNNYDKCKNTQKAVEEKLTDNEQTFDIDKLYDELFTTQTFDQEFAKEEIWEQMFSNRSSVQEVKQKSNKLDDDQYLVIAENNSLLCASVFAPPVDPISKVVITQPVTNKKCKHVYDSQTIFNYMSQRRHKAKCPYIGCNNQKIVASDLVEDSALKEKIFQYLETQQEEEDSDSTDE